MVRLHRGDQGIDGAAPQRMDGRRSDAVDAAGLRIARAQAERPPVLGTAGHAAILHLRCLRVLTIDPAVHRAAEELRVGNALSMYLVQALQDPLERSRKQSARLQHAVPTLVGAWSLTGSAPGANFRRRRSGADYSTGWEKLEGGLNDVHRSSPLSHRYSMPSASRKPRMTAACTPSSSRRVRRADCQGGGRLRNALRMSNFR